MIMTVRSPLLEWLRSPVRRGVAALGIALVLGACATGAAQTPAAQQVPSSQGAQDTPSTAQGGLDLKPTARDDEIRARLQRVLEATGWFTAPRVRVQEGVVFLSGAAATDTLRTWAGSLAGKTEGVSAVVNRIEVPTPSAWDFSSGQSALANLWHDAVRAIPVFLLGLVILTVSAVLAWVAARRTRALLSNRVPAKLLRGVLAWGVGTLVFLTGTYVVLRVAGLTQLALTLVGGTGLLGLAVGIAFRDITENFLASIFLSVQRPFETGDLVEVSAVTGYVQQLNVRTTVLMTLDGNLVQIPNATIYKSTLVNFTANPNRRESFVVGIGYDDSIDEAQEVARKVLANHPAVLNDPEPWVLADDLGKATVNLRIYFWLDGHQHSWLKVRSSVIRLVKRAFQEHGISMPDEAREVIFPQGVPVEMIAQSRDANRVLSGAGAGAVEPREPVPPADSAAVATKAEGGLGSEKGTLQEQARQAKPLGDAENLLDPLHAATVGK
jgi:small conductance mechanosensitive channel